MVCYFYLSQTFAETFDDQGFKHMQSLPNVAVSAPFFAFLQSEGGNWLQDTVWFKPVISGKSTAFSPDGTLLATTGGYYTLIYRVSNGSLESILEGRIDSAASVAFSPNGQLLALGGYRIIELWCVSDKKLMKTLEGHEYKVQSVAFSPDGQLLASGSSDGTIKLWHVSDGKLIKSLRARIWEVFSVAFSPDGQLLASGGGNGSIKLWRVSDGELVNTLEGHSDGVSSVTFSPDGRLLVSGSWDKTIKLWRVSDGELVRTLKGHPGSVSSVAFSPDGRLLASGGRDGTIKLWRVSDGELVRTLEGHSLDVWFIAFSPDGRLLASGGWDGTIKLWRVSDGELVRTLEGHSLDVWFIAFSPDGRLLASGGRDGTIKLWRVSDGRLIKTLEGDTHDVQFVIFSPDGQLLASRDVNKTVKLWSIPDGNLVESYTNMGFITFSPDCRLVSLERMGDTIGLWHVSSERRNLFKVTDIWPCALSADGQLLALGNSDGTIKLLSMPNGWLIRILKGHTGKVNSIAFSPDGQLLASGSQDEIKLWRISDGKLVKTLKWCAIFESTVTFSPDGQFLASSSERGIAVWRMKMGTTPAYPWDVNEDGKVNIFDLVIVAKSFGEKVTGVIRPNPDVNGDGVVNIFDLVIIGKHFGEGGEVKIPSPPSTFMKEKAEVRMKFERIGEFVILRIWAKSASKIYGFQFDISFNPKGIEIVSISKGELLEERSFFLHSVDKGRIKVAATMLGREGGIQGEEALTVVKFRPSTLKKLSARIERALMINPKGDRMKVVILKREVLAEDTLKPERTELLQNYPNPFNPETWIPFELAEGAEATIKIYDSNGHLIKVLKLGWREKGLYITKGRAAYWDGKNDKGEKVPSGIYFYAMEIGGVKMVKRMVIIR
jgi:WD40 repeat protein